MTFVNAFLLLPIRCLQWDLFLTIKDTVIFVEKKETAVKLTLHWFISCLNIHCRYSQILGCWKLRVEDWLIELRWFISAEYLAGFSWHFLWLWTTAWCSSTAINLSPSMSRWMRNKFKFSLSLSLLLILQVTVNLVVLVDLIICLNQWHRCWSTLK